MGPGPRVWPTVKRVIGRHIEGYTLPERHIEGYTLPERHIHREATLPTGIPQGGYLPTGIPQGVYTRVYHRVYIPGCTIGCITVGMPAMVYNGGYAGHGVQRWVSCTQRYTRVGILHPEVYQGGYLSPCVQRWVSLPVCTTVGILHPERHHGGYPAPREAPRWVYLTRMINNGGYTSPG